MYHDGVWKWKHIATSDKETGYEDTIDSLNIISVEDFKKLEYAEQIKLVREVISRIRDVNIYPIYYYSDAGIREELIKCIYHETAFIGDTLVENGRAGLTLLDFLFPNLHLVDSSTSTTNCMYNRFYDDDKMCRIILRHMKNYTFTNMRTPFFMYGRFYWSTATNFSPMRAKAIYERFAKPGSVVYDFSAGFGGRLLGALSSMQNKYTYIACEPCTDTAYNLNVLGNYIERITGRRNSYTIHQVGSEVLQLPANSIDFAFSCPPYYLLERYSDEATQSTVKYPKYNDWLEYYVKPTLQNAYNALKPGSKLGFVICDIYYRATRYPLVTDWCRLASECGLIFDKRYEIKTRSRKEDNNLEALYMFYKPCEGNE